jgi:hypothetical protein
LEINSAVYAHISGQGQQDGRVCGSRPSIVKTAIDIYPLRLAMALLGMLLPYTVVSAQSQLPAPSRTIYKCQVKGKVSYSDEPCVGAQRLDAVPTRGVDRLSGGTRTGNDVANEIRREQFAHALQPVTGMSASQFATAVRRHRLDAAGQRECSQLEPAILALEQAALRASPATMRPIHEDLFILRKRYKQLGC